MSNKQFNSVDGYSVGANGTISVVDANGNVSTNYLTVTTEANLGNVANITITGGSPNYVLSTDGAGNLSWVEQTGGGGNGTAIANGNSSVNIPTANGNINFDVTGNANVLVVTGTGANIAGTLNATGNANVGNLSATGVVATTLGGALTTAAQPNITSVGTLTSLAVSGNVTAANFVGNLANGNSDIAIPAANGNINFDVAGNANVLVVTGTGINVAGTLNATGNANVGNLTASRLTGTLTTASNAQPNITSVGTLTGLSLSTNADISLSGAASQITGANRVSASFLTGTLTTSAQPNITSVGTLSSLGVTGNITSGNANLGNLVTANYFQGDGSLLTNIPIGTTLSNGNSNVNIPTANGNINISAVGNANIVVVTGTGANIDGYANITGNLSAGNISTTRLTGTLTTASNAQPNITSVGTLTGLTLSTNADITLSGTQSRVTGANLVSASFLTGTLTTSAQPNITSVGTLTNVSVTGNVAAGNLTTTGVLTVTGSGQSNFSGNLNADNITAANGIFGATGTFTGNVSGSNIAGSGNLSVTGSGNVGGNLTVGSGSNGSITGANLISANYFQGDGSLLTNIPIGTSLSNGNSNVSIPAANGNVNISAVGNANVVVVTGTGANINGTLNATGNANVGNLGATGVLATTLGGTLTTAAQPNITSVGTLTSLTATGNVIAGNVYANSGTIGAQTLRGEGGNISNIQGGNVSGAVATATSATTAGTVTTAAQPNITSVGTLTSLSVTGTATAGNLSTGGNLSVSGNAVIGGNLTVDGNLVYVNVDTLAVEDPIINLQTGPNGAAPVANSGKDVGTALNYYDTQARIAFMGWDVSNSEFGLASQASISSEVVTFTAYGNLRVGNIIGNGQALTGLAGANVTGQVANALVAGTVYTAAQPNITSVGTLSSLAVTGNATAGNVYANSGTIGASLLSGTLTTAAQPNITSIGTLTSLSATGNITSGNANLGNLVTANYFQGDGSLLTNIPIGTSLSNGNSNVSIPTANGNVNISAVGNANVVVVTGTGINVAGTLNATGNANVGNIGATRGVFTNLTGEGGNISNIQGANVTGTVSSATTAGTVTTNAQPNITSVGTLSSLAVTGNANIGNLGTAQVLATANVTAPQFISNVATGTAPIVVASTTKVANLNADTVDGYDTDISNTANTIAVRDANGNVSANYFIGNGSQLTGIITSVSNVSNGNSNLDIAASGGNVTVSVAGNANILTVTGTGVNVSGTLNATGNANVGNLSATGVLATTLGGTLTTAAQPNITSVGTLSSLTATGNVISGNVYANSGTIGASLLAGTLTTAAQPNITSVGTLAGLNVSGNAQFTGQVVSLGSNGNVKINGGSSGQVLSTDGSGNLSWVSTGTANTANTAQTVTNNAQPNITSVGTLTSLEVTGNITSGNVYANSGTIGANLLTGTLTTAAQPNITSLGTLTGLGVNGDITAANITANTGVFTGNGSGLSALAGGNVTGQVANALVAGTVYTNAQPNITSVGTLTGLGVNGDITAANITANTGVFTGNANGLSSIQGANVVGTVSSATTAGTVTTAAQPNITSVGTLASLSVTGNLSSGNANLGNLAVANYFQGDGSLLTNIPGSTNLSNGNSNVSIPAANGNVNISAVGNANIVVVTGTGINVTGTLNATGNANVGNLGATGVLATTLGGTLTTAAQPNITSVGTLTSLTATGNVISGNVYANSGTIGAGTLKGEGGNISNIQGANVSGAVSSATTAGTVTTAAQPNITSVGTLTSLTVGGSITPSANITYDLGNNTNRFRDIYLANSTIYIGSQTISANATSVIISGNLAANVSGNITGALANGNSSVNIPAANGNVNISAVGNTTLVVTGTGANITGTANISGNANVGNLNTDGLIAANGNVSGGNLTTAGKLTVTGNVDFSGPNVSLGSVSNLKITGGTANALLQTDGSGNLVWTTPTTSYVHNQSSASTTWVVTHNLGVQYVNIQVIDSTGNSFTGRYNYPTITFNNTSALTVTFDSAQAGYAAVTSGGGSQGPQGNPGAAGGGIISNGISNVAITTSGGNVTVGVGGSANVATFTQTGANIAGTLNATGNANVGNLGTSGLITATGNVSGGNLTTTGVLTVSGTGTSSIAGNLDMTGNSITNLATPTNPTDAATKQYVDDVAQGLHTHDACLAATPDTLANITGGTITYNNGTAGVGANLVTTGSFNLIDGVNVQTAGTRILVKNEANTAHNGIYTWSNATVITRASDFDTPTEMAGGDFTFVQAGTLYDNTGWVMPDAVTTVGTSPVTWVQFSGAGTYTAGTGLTLTGTQFSVNTAQPTITSVGTLTALDVNGNITAANIIANTGVFTGNGSGLSQLAGGNVTGQVANSLVAGTVYTAAQPNITSVGTLTSLAVTGNATAGNVYANSGTIGASLLTGTLTTAAQPNITSVGTLASLSVSGNANTGNIGATRGVFTTVIGEGGNISNIQGANVSGAVASATSATTAGTVTTASQPNITSVGTLTSLAVSGTSNLGPVGNVTITGGTNGQVLTTNGSGGLSWTTVSGGGGGGASIANGTSNVNIPAANGNVNISAAGNANVLVVTGTGANITGIANINGNLIANNFTTGSGTGGNITGANVIFANTFVGMLANGNSDVAIPAANGNINFDVAGNANVVVITGTGVNVAGTLNATGNIISPNFVGALANGNSNITITSNANVSVFVAGNATARAVFTTTGANIAGTLNATGNANVGNIGAATAVITTAANVPLIQNGTSNITITSGGNVTLGVAGTARITAQSTGATIAGTAFVTTSVQAPNITANTGFFTASVTSGAAAAGTVQSNATAITTQFVQVGTVATGAGVRLPTATAGMRITIFNTSANALLVYPATNGIINALAANAAFSHAANTGIDYVSFSSTQWYTL